MCPHQGGICRGDRCHVLVTEFRGMALNGLFCAVVLRPLDLVLLIDFTYRYHPGPHPTKCNPIPTLTLQFCYLCCKNFKTEMHLVSPASKLLTSYRVHLSSGRTNRCTATKVIYAKLFPLLWYRYPVCWKPVPVSPLCSVTDVQ